MTRRCDDWLRTYVEYASHTEAPKLMHFWAAVWTIAGALRKKVWIDQIAFRWTPSFYIIFVAPPGVVSKSTTAGMASNILRQVPGINFGPDVVTWPALVTSFANARETFVYRGEEIPMSAINLVASEFGNLVDPEDKGMINLLIDLWDGRHSFEKRTKMSGNDSVDGPWINLLGCTTPHWIAENMPMATVGGGFTARCIFVYADKKEKLIAYPKFSFPADTQKTQENLLHDLEWISTALCGEYTITRKAMDWGEAWYEKHWHDATTRVQDDRLDGYMARKQTHLHKLAIVIAASARDELVINDEDLILASAMLEATEEDLDKVFSRIGKSESSIQADRFISYIKSRKACPYNEAYRAIHSYFPDFRNFEGIVSGAVKSGQIELVDDNGRTMVFYCGPE